MWEGLKIGDVLAHRYRIQACIGEGGMGRVFVAEDLKLSDKQWAVKEIQSDWANSEIGQEEAKTLLRLDHPQLPKIVDYYHMDAVGTTYLIMELVRGRTVGQFVAERGRMEEEQVIDLGMQICTIFSYLHGVTPEPIIHRDLKPDNIIIDGKSAVHLIDFGIARRYNELKLHDTVRLGSPGFLAPEQLRGEQSDARTDLFQLGAVLYYMLSGGTCYSREEQLVEITHVSKEMRELLGRLLQDRQERRPDAADEVHTELADLSRKLRRDKQADPPRASTYPPALDVKRIGYMLVGSAYEGAGSTITACGLAEAIASSGLSVGLVEYAHQPDLTYRLGGEHRAPKSYVYLTDRDHVHHVERSTHEWGDGRLVYYPQRPDTSAESLTPERWYRALLSIRTDAVVIDVGSHWQDAFVQEMMQQADYVICVIDGRMHKWLRPDVERVLEQLSELRTIRSSVYTVAYTNESKSSDWRSFPLPLDLKLTRELDASITHGAFDPLLKRWGIMRPSTRMKRRSMMSWIRSYPTES